MYISNLIDLCLLADLYNRPKRIIIYSAYIICFCFLPNLVLTKFLKISFIFELESELEPDSFFMTGPVRPVQKVDRSCPASNRPVYFGSQTGKNPARSNRESIRYSHKMIVITRFRYLCLGNL
jgi:hypothetical protein